jgi:hypothetical protein
MRPEIIQLLVRRLDLTTIINLKQLTKNKHKKYLKSISMHHSREYIWYLKQLLNLSNLMFLLSFVSPERFLMLKD